MPKRRIRVAAVDDFKKNNPIKFEIDARKEGFVVAWKNGYQAYENVCRHLPLPLDYGDGGFFSKDGTLLQCRNHGAEYDPATGLCVRGPCKGASLPKLPVSVEDGGVWVESEEQPT